MQLRTGGWQGQTEAGGARGSPQSAGTPCAPLSAAGTLLPRGLRGAQRALLHTASAHCHRKPAQKGCGSPASGGSVSQAVSSDGRQARAAPCRVTHSSLTRCAAQDDHTSQDCIQSLRRHATCSASKAAAQHSATTRQRAHTELTQARQSQRLQGSPPWCPGTRSKSSSGPPAPVRVAPQASPPACCVARGTSPSKTSAFLHPDCDDVADSMSRCGDVQLTRLHKLCFAPR